MKQSLQVLGMVVVPLMVCTANAAEHGNEAEAQQMVKKAVALMQSAGTETALKTFNDPGDKSFKDRDLFVFVYDFQGVMLAMGANQRMVGKNLLEMKDADGVPMARGMIEMVKSKGKGWYGPYKFVNPQSQAYEYKKSYCERAVGETLVCVGIHHGGSK